MQTSLLLHILFCVFTGGICSHRLRVQETVVWRFWHHQVKETLGKLHVSWNVSILLQWSIYILQARPLLSHRVALAQRPGSYAGNTSLETLSGDPSLPLIGGWEVQLDNLQRAAYAKGKNACSVSQQRIQQSRCWLCPRSSIRISCGSQGDMLQLLGLESAGLNMIFDAFMWMYSWTSNMNLFENDLVLFPMHIDLSHWVLAVADFRSKSVTSYDRWCPLTLYPWPCLSVWETLIKPLWRQYWPIWTPSTRPPKVQSWRDSGCVKLQIAPSRYLAFSACPMNHL